MYSYLLGKNEKNIYTQYVKNKKGVIKRSLSDSIAVGAPAIHHSLLGFKCSDRPGIRMIDSLSLILKGEYSN